MNKQLLHKGANINYKVSGTGEAVVLLHGFLEDLSMWDDITDKLVASSTVISLDLPGFGKSGIIEETHSMELMAEVVNEVLIAENFDHCTIIGHSMGGYVSLSMAELFPEKLVGLVLFHSQAADDDEQTKINRDRTIDIIKRNHSKFISNFIPDLFAEENISLYGDEIHKLISISLKTKDEGIIAALRGMRNRKDYRNLLSEVNFPVLFIVGKQDSKIPLEKINQQLILPRISESLILDKVGHMGFIEAKVNTFATVVNFIHKYK